MIIFSFFKNEFVKDKHHQHKDNEFSDKIYQASLVSLPCTGDFAIAENKRND